VNLTLLQNTKYVTSEGKCYMETLGMSEADFGGCIPGKLIQANYM